MKYREGDLFTFANGNIGIVTKLGKLAVTDRSGLSTPPRYMPTLERYLSHNDVVGYIPSAAPEGEAEEFFLPLVEAA